MFSRVLGRLPISLVGAALAIRLVDEWWSYLPAGIVDDLRRDLGITYSGSGWLLALLWAGALAGIPLAVLADHADRRLVAVGSSALLTVGLAVYALGASFPVLAAASVGLGVGGDLLIRAVEAAMAEEFGDFDDDDDDASTDSEASTDSDAVGDGHDGALARLLGRQHLLAFVGDLLGPALLGIGAVTPLGWRGAFGVTAAALAAYTAYLARVPFAPPVHGAAAPRAAARGLLEVARRPEVWWLAATDLLLNPLDEPFFALAVARVARATTTPGVEQLLAGGVLVGGVAGSLIVARAGLRGWRRHAGAPLLAAGAVAVAAFEPVVVQIAAFGVVGVGMGLLWAAIHHRMLTVIPGRSASVSAIVSTAGMPGAAAPAVLGVVADRAGLGAALWSYAALAGVLVVVTAGALRERTS